MIPGPEKSYFRAPSQEDLVLIKKTDDGHCFRFGATQQRSAIRRVMQTMQIPGKSGEELAVAEFIREELASVGVKPSQITTDSANRKTPLPSKTGNLIVHLPGIFCKP